VFKTTDLHGAIAKDIDGFGGILRCNTCGRWEWMTGSAGFLAHGWPKCHGYTMTWVTRRLLDEEGWTPDA
jgi:hypothetical protein